MEYPSRATPRINIDPPGLADGTVRKSHSEPAKAGAIVETFGSPELKRPDQRLRSHTATVVEYSNLDIGVFAQAREITRSHVHDTRSRLKGIVHKFGDGRT